MKHKQEPEHARGDKYVQFAWLFVFFFWVHPLCSLQDALGATADGQAVDLELLDGLIGMGFEAVAAAAALRQTNNDAGAAADILANRPELLATSGEFPDGRNREEERVRRARRREEAV